MVRATVAGLGRSRAASAAAQRSLLEHCFRAAGGFALEQVTANGQVAGSVVAFEPHSDTAPSAVDRTTFSMRWRRDQVSAADSRSRSRPSRSAHLPDSARERPAERASVSLAPAMILFVVVVGVTDGGPALMAEPGVRAEPGSVALPTEGAICYSPQRSGV